MLWMVAVYHILRLTYPQFVYSITRAKLTSNKEYNNNNNYYCDTLYDLGRRSSNGKDKDAHLELCQNRSGINKRGEAERDHSPW